MTGAVERYTRVHSDWDYYLLHGFRLAPTAPHDNHFANWGTGHSSRTGVIATSLSEAALLEALDARAVFASEDEELAVRVYVDGRVPMGSKLVTRGTTAKLDVFLSDANYTGSFDVAVFSGTIGGDAVREVKRQSIAGGSWQSITVDLPTISFAPGPGGSYSILEGDAGNTSLKFTVVLSEPSDHAVTVKSDARFLCESADGLSAAERDADHPEK